MQLGEEGKETLLVEGQVMVGHLMVRIYSLKFIKFITYKSLSSRNSMLNPSTYVIGAIHPAGRTHSGEKQSPGERKAH